MVHRPSLFWLVCLLVASIGRVLGSEVRWPAEVIWARQIVSAPAMLTLSSSNLIVGASGRLDSAWLVATTDGTVLVDESRTIPPVAYAVGTGRDEYLLLRANNDLLSIAAHRPDGSEVRSLPYLVRGGYQMALDSQENLYLVATEPGPVDRSKGRLVALTPDGRLRWSLDGVDGATPVLVTSEDAIAVTRQGRLLLLRPDGQIQALGPVVSPGNMVAGGDGTLWTETTVTGQPERVFLQIGPDGAVLRSRYGSFRQLVPPMSLPVLTPNPHPILAILENGGLVTHEANARRIYWADAQGVPERPVTLPGALEAAVVGLDGTVYAVSEQTLLPSGERANFLVAIRGTFPVATSGWPTLEGMPSRNRRAMPERLPDPAVRMVNASPLGGATVEVVSRPGDRMVLESSTNLTQWRAVAAWTADGLSRRIHDPEAKTGDSRLYRSRRLPAFP